MYRMKGIVRGNNYKGVIVYNIFKIISKKKEGKIRTNVRKKEATLGSVTSIEWKRKK